MLCDFFHHLSEDIGALSVAVEAKKSHLGCKGLDTMNKYCTSDVCVGLLMVRKKYEIKMALKLQVFIRRHNFLIRIAIVPTVFGVNDVFESGRNGFR